MSVNFNNYYPQEPTDAFGRCVLPCCDCRDKELEILRLKLEVAELKIQLKAAEDSMGCNCEEGAWG